MTGKHLISQALCLCNAELSVLWLLEVATPKIY